LLGSGLVADDGVEAGELQHAAGSFGRKAGIQRDESAAAVEGGDGAGVGDGAAGAEDADAARRGAQPVCDDAGPAAGGLIQGAVADLLAADGERGPVRLAGGDGGEVLRQVLP